MGGAVMIKLKYLNLFIDLLCRVFPQEIIKKDEMTIGNLAYYIDNVKDEQELENLKLNIQCKDINELCYMIIRKIHECYSMKEHGRKGEMERMCYELLKADYESGILDTINLVGYDDFPDWYKCYINIIHKIER